MSSAMVATGASAIRFYFDYISTNAYLAWQVLPKLAEQYGKRLEPVPVLFAGLLKAHGQLGPAEVPIKAFWMWKNNLRKAAILGVPLKQPAFHPFNPLLALRVSSLDLDERERFALIDALFNAVWAEQLHVSEPAVVRGVADRAGLPGARLVEQAQSPAAKNRLRTDTDAAIAAGVFGVPSMMVGDEVFWGYDDLPYLERLLAGTDPLDAAAVPTAETAPRPSAMRREVSRR
jgi:2-hydroxychromene-2-carboxylate isomerase